jgi:hypothetical protein
MDTLGSFSRDKASVKLTTQLRLIKVKDIRVSLVSHKFSLYGTQLSAKTISLLIVTVSIYIQGSEGIFVISSSQMFSFQKVKCG